MSSTQSPGVPKPAKDPAANVAAARPASPAKGLNRALLVVAGLACVALLAYLYHFGQNRYFTVDEYQYADATSMVADGMKPYVDFYEHHPPLSYSLHAPLVKLLRARLSFRQGALLFRKISFVYLAALALALFWHARSKTGDLLFAAFAVLLPLSLGFGLMSAIDYRADTFAAVLLLLSLLLLDGERRASSSSPTRNDPAPTSRKRFSWISGLAGALLAIAALMTQKTVYFAGLTFGVLLLDDWNARFLRGQEASNVHRFFSWLAGGTIVSVVVLGICAALGLLPRMIEIIVFDAIRHEALYTSLHFSEFARGYLAQTFASTALIGALAVYFFVDRRETLWIAASFAALATVFLTKAQYPYNFVYPCFLLGLCAARGLHALYQRLAVRAPTRVPLLRALFALVVLIVSFDQVSFTFGRTSNRHQLALYDKLESLSTPQDRVIDNAGAALFLRPASYFFLHGAAHRTLFRSYFERNLVEDYRRSGARFLIDDFRFRDLPPVVANYTRSHFLRVDGDLYAYGFGLPADDPGDDLTFEILLPGEYHLFDQAELLQVREGEAPKGTTYFERVSIDGMPAPGPSVKLEPGMHHLRVQGAGEVGYLSSVPLAAYRPTIPAGLRHTMLFEY